MTLTLRCTLLATLALTAAGCVADDDLPETGEVAASLASSEGSDDALAIVAVANTSSLAELDEAPPVGAGLDRRAAENLVAKRPFGTLAAVDAVPYVGPAALERLLERAHVLDLVGDHDTSTTSRHGIDEVSDEAAGLLKLANTAPAAELADPAKVGLDPVAVTELVARRPLQSLAALDAVPRIGPVSFDKLRVYAAAHGWTPTWRDLFPTGTVERKIQIGLPTSWQSCRQYATPPYHTSCDPASSGTSYPSCRIEGTNPGPLTINCLAIPGWVALVTTIAEDGTFAAYAGAGGYNAQMSGRFDAQGVVFDSWRRVESWVNVYDELVMYKTWSTAPARGEVVFP